MHIRITRPLDFYHRYQSIVEDWGAFEDSLQKPLPATIWTNTLRTSPDALLDKMPLTPIPWYPGAFRLPPGVKPATPLPFLAGHYHIQEEAALLPVVLLDPQPGETILDLCAAPGNKTVQMAVAMASSGLVVANDRSRDRLGILQRSVRRLGLTNIAITAQDATCLPGQPGCFDRVLADVPCSGEGTIRRHKKTTAFITTQRRNHLCAIQSAILDRAILLCKTGGRIVYSTCTFAPEENEAVINAALLKYPHQLMIVEAQVKGFNTSAGLLSWNGQHFQQALQHAHRIWPHQNDTGGFFVAVLRKIQSTKTAAENTPFEPLKPESRAQLPGIFQQRFGISPDLFDGMWLEKMGKSIFIRSFDALPPGLSGSVQNGLPFCRPPEKSQKIKTAAALKWGHFATKNVIELTRDQAYAHANSTTFEINPHQLEMHTTPGLVLLKHKDMHLGPGLLRIHNGVTTIESQLPKHWVNARPTPI